jgi:hypothetical protein
MKYPSEKKYAVMMDEYRVMKKFDLFSDAQRPRFSSDLCCYIYDQTLHCRRRKSGSTLSDAV